MKQSGGCNRSSCELLSMPWLCTAFHNVLARPCGAVTDVINVCYASAYATIRQCFRGNPGCTEGGVEFPRVCMQFTE